MTEFASPATGGNVLKPVDIQGHLLVVEPIEFVENMPTSMGESDAVRVTVHDINNKTTTEDVLWFSRVLVSSLRNRIGQKVLGVMGTGVAKPNQTAPWVLHDASGEPEAVKAATEYLTGQVASSLAQASNGNDELLAALSTLKPKVVQTT